MKFLINIILLFAFLYMAEYGYAQETNTEFISKFTMSASNFYLNGKLLSESEGKLTLKRADKISYFSVNKKKSFVSIGAVINTNLFDNNNYHTSINMTNLEFIKNKDSSNIKFDFTNENEEEHFYDKTIFKILLGSFVAFGATTAYFKIKADKNFKDYKKIKNSSLLDDTNKYDAISGVTFALMQINLGVLVYYFLRD